MIEGREGNQVGRGDRCDRRGDRQKGGEVHYQVTELPIIFADSHFDSE